MSELPINLKRPEQAAVAVILKDSNLLVIRRSQHVRAPGKICLPGGGIERHESPDQAIVREMKEEINVAALPIRSIWQSVSPWGVKLHWWLTEIRDEPIANPQEVESIHWMSIQQLMEIADKLESLDDFLIAVAGGNVNFAIS